MLIRHRPDLRLAFHLPRLFFIRPRVPELVERNPQRARVPKEPSWKEHGKCAEHEQSLWICEHIAEEHGEIHHDDDGRSDSVVEVDRAEQVAGLTIEPAHTSLEFVVHRKPASKDWSFTAARAAQAYRPPQQ